jgi:hypothetical protein
MDFFKFIEGMLFFRSLRSNMFLGLETGGGRNLFEDIIEKNNSLTEKKFLHDYSYILFEEALFKENRVLEINSNNIVNIMFLT